MTTEPPVRVTIEEEGSLLRLTLNRPKANVLDAAMVGALRDALAKLDDQPAVRSVLIAAAGKHFSFGASVEEHQPDRVADMLSTFHALFRDLLNSGRVLLAAVSGQCLGGGLELAAFCQRVFAAPGAVLGQPEIKLAAIAPIGSVVLPLRCGQGAADDLLLTGRSVGAEEALRLGVVDEVCEEPVEAALAWHRTHLVPLSAAALRHAVWASRLALRRAVEEDLPRLEQRYTEQLMATADGPEGIAAFLEKRSPTWSHK